MVNVLTRFEANVAGLSILDEVTTLDLGLDGAVGKGEAEEEGVAKHAGFSLYLALLVEDVGGGVVVSRYIWKRAMALSSALSSSLSSLSRIFSTVRSLPGFRR